KGPEELSRVLQKQKEEGRQRAIERARQKAAEPKQRSRGRQEAREHNGDRNERPHTPTAEESARNWLEYRQSHGPGRTAAESARNWLEYRESHGAGPTAKEALDNWRAYRESEGPKSRRPAHDNEAKETRVKDHSRDNDYGLE